MSSLLFVSSFSVLSAQSSNTVAGLTGAGAGAALGAGAGQNSTVPSSLAGAGGAGAGAGTAPIEIQLMAHEGLKKLAASIVRTSTEDFGCAETSHDCSANLPALLIEDSNSAMQVGLYEALRGYYDHIRLLHDELQSAFALVVTPASLNFTAAAPSQTVIISNTGPAPIVIQGITITPLTYFTLVSASCTGGSTTSMGGQSTLTVPGNGQCSLSVKFNPGTPSGQAPPVQASLMIPNPRSRDAIARNLPIEYQDVQLTGTIPAAQPVPQKPRLTQEEERSLEELRKKFQSNQWDLVPEQTTPNPSPPSSTGGANTSQTPASLSYLSGIMGALADLKSGVAYNAASAQPTTQTFQVLVEAELARLNVKPYSSTSALNLEQGSKEVSLLFGRMLSYGSDMTNWATQCKSLPGAAQSSTNGGSGSAPGGAAPSSSPSSGSAGLQSAFNPVCSHSDVNLKLSAAQQMITAYVTLLQTTTDSNSSPIIVDLLRGAELASKMKEGIPSLQLNVTAGGGSTRTNSFFLLNLFYTPKPSYNAGVVATFELRDNENKLIRAGAKTVLFDYVATRNLKPSRFKIDDLDPSHDCGSFCRDR
ncbi:MAG TPA: hypothetical protein VMF91_12990 [Bryobacteraceae bacterium]|nr:hypothetical protein [Bryobacteraceae bacterium]